MGRNDNLLIVDTVPDAFFTCGDGFMNEGFKHTILFVDDEEPILNALMRLFRRQGFELLTASGGEAALALLETEGPRVSVIVSDQKMPNMNGAVFLEKSKAMCPDAVRILLTGYSDMDAIVDAVNRGEIHRYLTKPWNDDELVTAVKKAVEQYDLVAENKRLLALTRRQNKQLYDLARNMEKKVEERSRQIVEKNRELEFLNKELEMSQLNTIRAFAALTEMTHPHMKGHGKRVSDFAVDMARALGLGEEEVTRIEIAAILHDIGTIGFSPALIDKRAENRCSDQDMAQYRTHAVEGQSILAFISGFDDVGLLIRHHHERYDGKGYPDQLVESEIPLGARIIAVADIYDRLTHLPKPRRTSLVDAFLADGGMTRDDLTDDELMRQAALFHIKQQAFSAYDPDIVKVFMEVLRQRGVNLTRESQVRFSALKPGMCLTRSIYSHNGRFILPHKTELTERIIAKLSIILENNDISDAFYILNS
ncbi:response regulator [Desulfatiferula olefinivorans]